MTKLRSAILASIQVAGGLTLAAMAPNVLSLIGYAQKRQSEKLSSALTRLKKKGLVRFDGNKASLTPEGRRFLASHPLRIERPWRWDRKWRVVIFDIPEDRKAERKMFRILLRRLGFLKLQHSVWVFPYDCEELVALIKTERHLHKEVLYMIVDKIERPASILKHFRLPQ